VGVEEVLAPPQLGSKAMATSEQAARSGNDSFIIPQR
jgi:hypothetical protein